jgi:hypothetical protein
MPDITSLTVVVGLLFSLLVSQAAFNSDNMRIRITVSPDIAKTGFSEPVAEELFAAVAANLTSGDSLVAPPTLRIHSQPGITSTLAENFSLGGIVAATQTSLGVPTMSVKAAIMQQTMPETMPVGAEPPKPGEAAKPAETAKPTAAASKTCLDMLLVVTHPDYGIEQNRITQCDSSDPILLVQKGAAWAMERVSPYRVALAEILCVAQGAGGTLADAKATTLRILSRPWAVEKASERALTYNLLAMIALAEKDPVASDQWLKEALEVPEVHPRIRRLVTMNQAMVATVRKQPGDARTLLTKAMAEGYSIDLPDFAANSLVMQALIAWSGGDAVKAEALLRDAGRVSEKNQAVHYYLAKLLTLKGDTAGAARETNAANAARRFDPTSQALVVALFWIDPVNGTTDWRK